MRQLRRLLGYFRPYASTMITSYVLLAIAGALMAVVVALFDPLINLVLTAEGSTAGTLPDSSIGRLLEWLLERIPVDAWIDWLRGRAFVAIPLIFVAVFFVRSVFVYFGQYLSVRAGSMIIRDVREQLYESVMHQTQRFFQAYPTGQILSRVLSDVSRIQRVSTTVLADVVRVAAMVPFLLVVIFVQDWRLSLFSIVGLPLLAYPMVRLGSRLRRASTLSQETVADVSHMLTETVQGAKVVQGFTRESFEVSRFRDALNRVLRADLRAGRAAALAPAVMELIGAMAAAAIFAFAGVFVAKQTLDVGTFVAVLTGLGLLFMSFRRLNACNLEIQQALAAAVRVFEVLDHHREIHDAPDAVELPPFREEIRLDRVCFAYEDDNVLHDVDLVVRRGEMVALVGASGSGKTTIANLLARFYDPTSGGIRIDGLDLRQVTLKSLRSQIGLVTQETILFDESVRNNIAYGCGDTPLESVQRAARMANADEFIAQLPRGYDTVLGERGARLSMGQRQRVAIARALLKDPPILILDEATSALDTESESLVQAALDNLLEGRTSVVIAHRLSTVRQATRIVVLHAGRIVEQGTHRELLELDGVYARLYDLQFREDEDRLE